MHFKPNVFDVWAFQRRAEGVVFLLLHASEEKAARYFNGMVCVPNRSGRASTRI